MEAKGKIIVKEVTKEKIDFVDKEMETILNLKEGTTTIKGFTISRLKNIFIVL